MNYTVFFTPMEGSPDQYWFEYATFEEAVKQHDYLLTDPTVRSVLIQSTKSPASE